MYLFYRLESYFCLLEKAIYLGFKAISINKIAIFSIFFRLDKYSISTSISAGELFLSVIQLFLPMMKLFISIRQLFLSVRELFLSISQLSFSVREIFSRLDSYFSG